MSSSSPRKNASPAHSHIGHRERMKNQFKRGGLSGFHEHQILEMLLFYPIPQKDTNPLAHALLDRFGSLLNVFRASEEELVKVSGIGPHTASFLRAFSEFAASALENQPCVRQPLHSYTAVGDFFANFYRDKKEEIVTALFLNNNFEPISFDILGYCSIHSAQFHPNDICRMAMKKHASMVAIAHNHPDSLLIPTLDDENTTRMIREAFTLLDLTLLEHYLVSGEKYISLSPPTPSTNLLDPVDMFHKNGPCSMPSFRASALLCPTTWEDDGEKAPIVPAQIIEGNAQFFQKENAHTVHLLSRLLSFAVRPPKRAEETAAALLDTYDQLPYICAATSEQLAENGFTEHVSVLLNMALPAYSTACINDNATVGALTSARKIGSMLVYRYIGLVRETVFLLLLDAKMNKIDMICVGEGSVNAANLTVRRLTELVLFRGASYAVLAHNHPFGNVRPSNADIQTTTVIKETFAMVNCTLLEHFIVSGSHFLPMLLTTDKVDFAALPKNFYDEQMLEAVRHFKGEV